MIVISKFISCWTSQRYEALQKKDDDFGIEKAQKWIEQNPLNPEKIRGLNYIQIDKHAFSIIQGLRKFAITDSNLEMIRDHLIRLAKQNDLLNQYLIKYISRVNTDKGTRKQLKIDLIGTCPD